MVRLFKWFELNYIDAAPRCTYRYTVHSYPSSKYNNALTTILYVCISTCYILSSFFEDVSLAKPRASRNSSIEGFLVCRNYQPPSWYEPNMEDPIQIDNIIGIENNNDENNDENDENDEKITFV